MLRKFLAGAYLLIIAAIPFSAQAKDLQSSLEYFYRTNPNVLGQIETLRAQNELYIQALSAFGPHVSVSFEPDYQKASVDQTNLFGQKYTANFIGQTATYTLGLTQTIFSGGRLTAQLSGAQSDILAAREAARVALAQSFRDAIRAYTDVIRDGDILRDLQHARDLLERDLSDMQEKFKVGAAAISDRAEILARLAAARTQVTNAEGQLQQSRSAFLNIIGQEPTELVQPPHLPALPSTRDNAVGAALSESPTLKQAIFEEASARSKVALARSAYSPDISLRIGLESQPTEQYFSNLQDRSLTAGLVAEVPIYTSGETSSKVRRAEAEARSARFKIESARRVVVQSAEQAFASYETAQQKTRLLSEQVRADQVAYESLNEQFKSGLISTIDLLNSEQELSNAEISLASATHDAILAEADLLSAAGRLESDVLIPEARPNNPETDFRKLYLVAADLPTTMLVREIDSLAPAGSTHVRHIPAQPLEPPVQPDPPPNSLDDIDPARLEAAVPPDAAPR